ncbi:tellurite resistance/C4-dicarboxylate transporter family protein [Streptomyces sp. NPDC005492]|uniref:tellurite resistance/C4-dicarboxylate transporter family protein n=1 Tax=Streptomyces sp. NPDC005492 TaxID=3156883 RepID=UPI0033A68A33
MSGTSRFRAWWAQRPPAAGAAVMATGIVSVGLHLRGYEVLSRIAFTLACVCWLGLAADFAVRLLWDRRRWLTEAESPGALTAVAATAVLGTRFSLAGRQPVAEALLALAAVLWPVLLVRVVGNWQGRMPGTVFLGCVATQSLAVLAATLAAAESVAWLAHTALVLFWFGLVLYGFALARFDMRQVITGAGDHWIAGGALAVSALAGSKLIAADSARLYLWNSDNRGVLRAVTVTLLVLDLAWCVVLAAAEVARPRPRYDVRRWSTVFPLGMTAAATLSVGSAVDISSLRTPGEVVLWIAVAVWLVVATGTVRSYLAAPAGVTSTGPR